MVGVESVDQDADVVLVDDFSLRRDVVAHDGEQARAEYLQAVRRAVDILSVIRKGTTAMRLSLPLTQQPGRVHQQAVGRAVPRSHARRAPMPSRRPERRLLPPHRLAKHPEQQGRVPRRQDAERGRVVGIRRRDSGRWRSVRVGRGRAARLPGLLDRRRRRGGRDRGHCSTAGRGGHDDAALAFLVPERRLVLPGQRSYVPLSRRRCVRRLRGNFAGAGQRAAVRGKAEQPVQVDLRRQFLRAATGQPARGQHARSPRRVVLGRRGRRRVNLVRVLLIVVGRISELELQQYRLEDSARRRPH